MTQCSGPLSPSPLSLSPPPPLPLVPYMNSWTLTFSPGLIRRKTNAVHNWVPIMPCYTSAGSMLCDWKITLATDGMSVCVEDRVRMLRPSWSRRSLFHTLASTHTHRHTHANKQKTRVLDLHPRHCSWCRSSFLCAQWERPGTVETEAPLGLNEAPTSQRKLQLGSRNCLESSWQLRNTISVKNDSGRKLLMTRMNQIVLRRAEFCITVYICHLLI